VDDSLITKAEQTKINFLKTQAEKSFYLNEYKENVSMALTDEQINSGLVYQDIINEMKKSSTACIKMRRDIPLKNLKPYILEAEKLNVRYTLVDALDLQGNIGLVVVTKEPFDTNDREIVLEDIGDKFEKAGLYREYIKYFGEKLCTRHYNLVAEKLPEYKERFQELTLMDRIFGKECPICRLEKEKNR
jgi:uncharacterized protein YueI